MGGLSKSYTFQIVRSLGPTKRFSNWLDVAKYLLTLVFIIELKSLVDLGYMDISVAAAKHAQESILLHY